jgi:hypothetical protein
LLTHFFNRVESAVCEHEIQQTQSCWRSILMLFLLNDVMLNLGTAGAPPPLDARSMQALTFPAIERMGTEMYSQEPLLHRKDAERAARLAMLIAAKQPEVNGALFAAPSKGCSPDLVQVRYVSLSLEMLAALYAEHRGGGLTPFTADRQVWRRMAA